MKKVIMEVGAPGSGKSTCAFNKCKADSNYVRVNRDDIRSMGFGITEWTLQREKWVVAVEMKSVVAALKNGFTPIVDSTNLTSTRLHNFREVGKQEGFEIEICDHMNVPLAELIRRDSQRTGKARVGRVVIERLLAQAGLLPKTTRNVVICMLDGFLANSQHRENIVDKHEYYAQCDLDTVFESGARLVRRFAKENDIWIVSTRPDFHVDEEGDILRVGDVAALWLESNDIPFSHLFMRRAIDTSSDVAVKEEIFKGLILGNIPKDQVLCVMDNDESSRSMWNDNYISPVVDKIAVDTVG